MSRRPQPVVLFRRAALVAVVCALASAACGGPKTPPNELETTYFTTAEYPDSSLVRIIVGKGRDRRVLLGRDFLPSERGFPHSAPVVVPDTGTLPVRVALVGTSGDTLAAVSYAVTLEPNHAYAVGVQAGGKRPHGYCVGPGVAAPIHPARTPGDSLFLTVGSMERGIGC